MVVGAAEAAGLEGLASRAARERVERERRMKGRKKRCIVAWMSAIWMCNDVGVIAF